MTASHLGIKFNTLFFTPYCCGTSFCRDTVMVSHHDKVICKAIYIENKDGE